MTYVMSDIHGCYDLFLRMLGKIKFSDGDRLYLLGDYVDRGDKPLEVLNHIANDPRIVPLMGNHDMNAYTFLSMLDEGIEASEYERIKPHIDAWLHDGAGVTLTAFKGLSKLERAKYFLQILNFKPYVELTIDEHRFLLCHSGLQNYVEGKPLEEYELADFIFGRTDYSVPHPYGGTVVTGHTPTALVDENCLGRILKINNYIDIDCGAAFELGLGCLCLDTMEEFYVE